MKKYVGIECNEERRHLRIDINAMCDIEDLLGKPISAIGDTMGMKEMRVVLFCGMKWEDKTLTLKGTGEIMQNIIESKGMEYLGKKLAEAMELALGKSNNDDKVEVTEEKN